MSTHKWLPQISDNPDETLYHISLLFKRIPRQGQCDLLFILPKPPYPSAPMCKLKINISFRTSKHRYGCFVLCPVCHLRHDVLWHKFKGCYLILNQIKSSILSLIWNCCSIIFPFSKIVSISCIKNKVYFYI